MHNTKPRIAKLITNFKKIEIQQLFKTSKRICSYPGLDIRISSTKEDFGKALIITPKKIGNAPTRNLIKRRIKSIFYQEKIFLHPYNWIFYCYKEISLLNFQDLKNIILGCIDHTKHQ